jgi:hypothetical protein
MATIQKLDIPRFLFAFRFAFTHLLREQGLFYSFPGRVSVRAGFLLKTKKRIGNQKKLSNHLVV